MTLRCTPTLDKRSPIPLYHQLAGWLEDNIVQGTFEIGSKLPPENRLSENFEVTRNTVRHAISELVQKGLVEKRRGIGTIVRRKSPLHPIRQLGRMTSFVDDFDFKDVQFEDRVLVKDLIKATPDLAGKLMLNPGDGIVMIERIRLADRTPFVLEKQFYSFAHFSRLLDIEIKGSMYRLLVDEFGVDLHHSIQTLRAVRPTRDIAQKLGISRVIPCIFLESIAYTSDDVPLEVLQSFYRGDRYLFKVESGQYRREMSTVVE